MFPGGRGGLIVSCTCFGLGTWCSRAQEFLCGNAGGIKCAFEVLDGQEKLDVVS